ncbi:hypothetical protein STEG23_030086, partial [Scotinomys teguina]
FLSVFYSKPKSSEAKACAHDGVQLDSWSSAWNPAMDLCICSHQSLDEGSMMTGPSDHQSRLIQDILKQQQQQQQQQEQKQMLLTRTPSDPGDEFREYAKSAFEPSYASGILPSRHLTSGKILPCTASNLALTEAMEAAEKGRGGQAYTIQGQYAIPQPDLTKLHQLAMKQSHFPMTHGNTGFSGIESSSPEVKGYRAGLDASAQTTSHELTIPKDLIGCIIERQGAKINEIRQMSGAQIKIANPVEGSTDRQVTITGSAASVSLAQYLINVRLSSETGGMGNS